MDKIKGFFKAILRNIKSFFVNFFPEGFPKKKLFPLLLLLIMEAASNTILSSYVGFLIVDMGTAPNVNEAGDYTGWLASAFSIGQLFSSFIIGALSDNFGRRPMLLIGTFGIALTNLLFGFSFNFYYAVAVRLLNGMLNGNIGVIKTYMGEITTNKNRVKAFSFIGLTYALGSVIGSFLGGVLYDPCKLYPSTFGETGLFKTFPALFPQLLMGIVGFIALILAYIFLQENEVMKREKTEGGNKCKAILLSIKSVFVKMIEFFNKENKWSLYAMLNYFLINFTNTTFMVIYPLLMIASVGKGGFGMSTSELGIFSALCSVGTILTLIFVYNPLVKGFGTSFEIE